MVKVHHFPKALSPGCLRWASASPDLRQTVVLRSFDIQVDPEFSMVGSFPFTFALKYVRFQADAGTNEAETV